MCSSDLSRVTSSEGFPRSARGKDVHVVTFVAQSVRNPFAGFGIALVAVIAVAIVGGLWFANRRR